VSGHPLFGRCLLGGCLVGHPGSHRVPSTESSNVLAAAGSRPGGNRSCRSDGGRRTPVSVTCLRPCGVPAPRVWEKQVPTDGR
jgi:hypothetical protein